MRDTFSNWTVSAGTQRNIDAARYLFCWSLDLLRRLLRRRNQLLEISEERLKRVFKEDLHLYLRQIQIEQKFTEVDMQKRVTMSQ